MLRFEASGLRLVRVVSATGGGILLAAACSGGAGLDPEAVPDGQIVPVAHVDIEYSRNVSFESSQASAHFIYSQDTKSTRAASLTAVLTGTRESVPEPGRCQSLGAGSLAVSAPVELLEAGSVTIHTVSDRLPNGANLGSPEADEAPEAAPLEPALDEERSDQERSDAQLASAISPSGAPTAAPLEEPVTISLAPRAFPAVSSLASGVMYTSRDREIPLPALVEYQVQIEGSHQVPAMTLHGLAPGYLTHVTVGGTPLEQVTTLAANSPIDITWDVGSTNGKDADETQDLIVVDVTDAHDGRAVLRCSYLDGAGAGTVPWMSALTDLLEDTTRAGLHVHRVRLVETKTGMGAATGESQRNSAALGELRFDFELTRDIEFR